MIRWFETVGDHSDIVISSRIRLARNLVNYPFCGRLTPEQEKQLKAEVKNALEKINLGDNSLQFMEVGQLSQNEGLSMVENHIVSPDFLENKNALLALSKDDSVSIMVNEEDHLRVQVLASGLDLERALDIANKMDDVLDESLDYAFDDQLGFLTACPSNLGTGLRASVMLHIPALEKAGALNKMSGTISKLGLTLRGTYGEGSKALGSIYQLSNQITLGISEEQAVKNLHEITLQIIEKEREARKALVKSEKFVDQIYRCYGILKYAKLISSEEFFDLMSYVRIGISEKVLTSDIAEHVTMQKLNYLLSQVGSATISQNAKEDLPPEKRDSIRAKIIQEIL